MSAAAHTSDDALLETWHGLLEAHARAHASLERALKPHEHRRERVRGARAPGRATTPAISAACRSWAKALHLSQSALSRVVARLERDGLAERGMCPDDRRGIFVCITDAGRERYDQARPAQRAALAAAL